MKNFSSAELSKTLVLNGDGTDIEFLRLEDPEEIDSFIAVTENEQTNLLSALLAKHLGVRQTLIHVSTTEYIPAMKVIGLDAVVSKNMCTVTEILEYIKSDEKIENPIQYNSPNSIYLGMKAIISIAKK